MNRFDLINTIPFEGQKLSEDTLIKIKGLQDLNRILNSSNANFILGAELYGKLKVRALDLTNELFPGVKISNTIDENDLTAALESNSDFHSWSVIEKMLLKDPNLKAARKDWDNTYNQEYIHCMLNTGIVKVFKSNKKNAFKSVIHSYGPSVDDRETADWYII